MDDYFGIAAFRSRQQVLRLDAALRRAGIRSQVVSTPRDVAIGCGLSARFSLDDLARVRAVLDQLRPSNMIGIYAVDRREGGRPKLTTLGTRG